MSAQIWLTVEVPTFSEIFSRRKSNSLPSAPRGSVRGTPRARGMGADSTGRSGGGCFACLFGDKSFAKNDDQRPSSGHETSVSSRRSNLNTSIAAEREKDELALASRRAVVNAGDTEPDMDEFLREPWWGDTRDDVMAHATARQDKVKTDPETEFDRTETDFESEMENLERLHVARVLGEQRRRIVARVRE